MDKRKLSQEPPSLSGADGGRSSGRSSNTSGTVTLEALHQLAASYFTDRESTLRRLHHLQIASSAIRVRASPGGAEGEETPPLALSASQKGCTLYKTSRWSFSILGQIHRIFMNQSQPRFIFLCFPSHNIKTGRYQEAQIGFVSFQYQYFLQMLLSFF